MRIIQSIKKMQTISANLRRDGKSVGFVPTMGALHDGHLSLIKQARKDNDVVVVSIFVNPTQFAPGEDFERYPRDLSKDISLCKGEGVDIIFYPRINQIYPEDYKTYVIVNELSDVLCGRFRPGHFRGVTTIVAKLFNIIQPEIAYFGQKDAQQAIIIQQMKRDLNIPVKIRIMPIVRDSDGLALSSRNRYLTHTEREGASILFESLRKAKQMVNQGINDSRLIIRRMRGIIKKNKYAQIQYINIVDLNTLKPVEKVKQRTLIALAVYIGNTRLIDNIIVNPTRGL